MVLQVYIKKYFLIQKLHEQKEKLNLFRIIHEEFMILLNAHDKTSTSQLNFDEKKFEKNLLNLFIR